MAPSKKKPMGKKTPQNKKVTAKKVTAKNLSVKTSAAKKVSGKKLTAKKANKTTFKGAAKVKKQTPAKEAKAKVPLKKTVSGKNKHSPTKSVHKNKPTKLSSKKTATLVLKGSVKSVGKTSTAARKVTSPKMAEKMPSKKSPSKVWLHPLDDRILVKVAEKEEKSAGGIILIDSTTQPDNQEGYVIAVGRGHQNKKGRIRPIELKAGDKIIFSKYAGDKVSQDGVNFVIIRETEVLGLASKE